MMTRPRLSTMVAVGVAAGISVAAISLLTTRSTATAEPGVHPVIQISVQNLDASAPIKNHSVVPGGTHFQVRVSTNGVDCAGAFVVTAAGAPGNPPSVLVNVVPFIIGPFIGPPATSTEMLAGVRPDGRNDFKISATCAGAAPNQFAHDQFEFFVEAS